MLLYLEIFFCENIRERINEIPNTLSIPVLQWCVCVSIRVGPVIVKKKDPVVCE